MECNHMFYPGIHEVFYLSQLDFSNHLLIIRSSYFVAIIHLIISSLCGMRINSTSVRHIVRIFFNNSQHVILHWKISIFSVKKNMAFIDHLSGLCTYIFTNQLARLSDCLSFCIFNTLNILETNAKMTMFLYRNHKSALSMNSWHGTCCCSIDVLFSSNM